MFVHVYKFISLNLFLAYVGLRIHTQQSSPPTKLNQVFPQIRISLSFTTSEGTPYVKHRLPGAHYPPHHFIQHPLTWLSLNPTLISLVGKPHEPFHIHIDMILSTLSMRPSSFVFELFPQNVSYQLDIIHIYKLINLLIPPFLTDARLWAMTHTQHCVSLILLFLPLFLSLFLKSLSHSYSIKARACYQIKKCMTFINKF